MMLLNQGYLMILLNRETMDNYLNTIGRNQTWLAEKMGYDRSYISLVMNNRVKISRDFMAKTLVLTNMKFEDLFKILPVGDDRAFYGKDIHFQGEMMRSNRYYATISALEQRAIEIKSKLILDSKHDK